MSRKWCYYKSAKAVGLNFKLFKYGNNVSPTGPSERYFLNAINFYSGRNSHFNQVAMISYQVEHINIGNAMNLQTGAFTKPTHGRYAFGFSAKTDQTGTYFVTLRHNGRCE